MPILGRTSHAYLSLCVVLKPKLYITSTLNIDLILWHIQLIGNVKSWFKSWVISFTFQAYTLRHTLNFICGSLSEFHTCLNFKAVLALPKTARSPRHISFIWIVWCTLYVYPWLKQEFKVFIISGLAIIKNNLTFSA